MMYFCCSDCFEYLQSIDWLAARVWVELCMESTERKTPLIKVFNDHSSLRTLEKEGYILTTESPPHIKVKLLGEMMEFTDEDEEIEERIFCISGEHEN